MVKNRKVTKRVFGDYIGFRFSKEKKMERIGFTEKEVKKYLDGCIRYWRKWRDKGGSKTASYYIDAFQSVRTSLFGELLAKGRKRGMGEDKWFDEIDLSKKLIGRKIVQMEYGPDADGDQQLYYLVLEGGIKIGIARVHSASGRIEAEDRTKRYPDGTILRFQFLNWPNEKGGE